MGLVSFSSSRPLEFCFLLSGGGVFSVPSPTVTGRKNREKRRQCTATGRKSSLTGLSPDRHRAVTDIYLLSCGFYLARK